MGREGSAAAVGEARRAKLARSAREELRGLDMGVVSPAKGGWNG
jgi:hypothetical protein